MSSSPETSLISLFTLSGVVSCRSTSLRSFVVWISRIGNFVSCSSKMLKRKLTQVRIVRVQVPPSEEETECQNYLRNWYLRYGAALKSDISSLKYTRSAMCSRDNQHRLFAGTHTKQRIEDTSKYETSTKIEKQSSAMVDNIINYLLTDKRSRSVVITVSLKQKGQVELLPISSRYRNIAMGRDPLLGPSFAFIVEVSQEGCFVSRTQKTGA
ncbi:hypothetical protein TNCV_4421661 [Trichonephila clavipes]|nr:hypothetical protein TNCV_4421661 [Trichonephila clavipes]